MNEQGKLKIEHEFAVKCVGKLADGTRFFDKYSFAELIVKECVEKCKTDWYGDSLDDICVQMLNHFGVEE